MHLTRIFEVDAMHSRHVCIREASIDRYARMAPIWLSLFKLISSFVSVSPIVCLCLSPSKDKPSLQTSHSLIIVRIRMMYALHSQRWSLTLSAGIKNSLWRFETFQFGPFIDNYNRLSENRGWTNCDRVTEGFHTPAIILSIDFMIRLWTEKEKQKSVVNYSYSNCSISCSLWYTYIIISNIVWNVYIILI